MMEDQVFNNDNLSFEVAASEASTISYNDPHSEIETSGKSNNDEHDDDGPGGPDDVIATAPATTTRNKRKKYALGFVASLALLSLIIGLSAGLSGRKNRSAGRSSDASAANSALTLDECLAEAESEAAEGEEALEIQLEGSSFEIPTNMPVSFAIEMEESEEEDESRDEETMTTAAFSNDISEPAYSNDMSQLLGVRRDLRGSGSSSRNNKTIKGQEIFPRSKSRRLQCDDIIAGAANKSSNMKKDKKKKKKKQKKDKSTKKKDGESLIAVIDTFSPVSNGLGTTCKNCASVLGDITSGSVETGCKNCYGPARGIVTINGNKDGSFLMATDLEIGNPNSVAFIANTTSCNEIDQYTFLHNLEPVPPDEVSNQFVGLSVVDGFSNNASRIDNGFLADDNEGYAIVIVMFPVYIGCGILSYAINNEPSDGMLLKATMDVYPGYTPGLTVSGSVAVAYRNDGTFKFSYNLEGVETTCADGTCGIHIHAGTSCATDNAVQGHYWNWLILQDLWTTAGGAVYVADDMGNAEGFFSLYNGFSFGKNLGHAVVVHDHNGTRIACGVLEAFV